MPLSAMSRSARSPSALKSRRPRPTRQALTRLNSPSTRSPPQPPQPPSRLRPSTSVFGQTVTFTATITPGGGASPSTGTVDFYNGDVLLGAGTLKSPGLWTFSTNSLAVGSYPDITARYEGGNSGYMNSTSPDFAQTVNQSSTQSTLSASPNPALSGQTVVFTATVTAVGPGAGTPTGTVTFYDGNQVLGTGTQVSPGVWTFSTATLPVAQTRSPSPTAATPISRRAPHPPRTRPSLLPATRR